MGDVHRAHVARAAPEQVPLPGGYSVGDSVCYLGPQITVGGRRGYSYGRGTWTLRSGMVGTVVEAGVLENYVKVQFAGKALSLPIDRFGEPPPARCRLAFF